MPRLRCSECDDADDEVDRRGGAGEDVADIEMRGDGGGDGDGAQESSGMLSAASAAVGGLWVRLGARVRRLRYGCDCWWARSGAEGRGEQRGAGGLRRGGRAGDATWIGWRLYCSWFNV